MGSVVAPVVCQAVIASGVPWPQFYFGSLVVCGINLALVIVAYWPTHEEFATELQELNRVETSDLEKVVEVAEPSKPSTDKFGVLINLLGAYSILLINGLTSSFKSAEEPIPLGIQLLHLVVLWHVCLSLLLTIYCALKSASRETVAQGYVSICDSSLVPRSLSFQAATFLLSARVSSQTSSVCIPP
jgi:hypothetical protein